MAICPQCRRNLTEVETPAGAALGCGGCAHVWLDTRSLEALRATALRHYRPDDVRALREESEARKRAALQRPVVYCRCPACGKQMHRRTFGEVSFLLLHHCVAHGYWIHRDELEGIAAYVTRGGEILEMRHVLDELEERVSRVESENRRLGERAGPTFVPLILPF
jgi:Zn-finger nucleic acid-binding protein